MKTAELEQILEGGTETRKHEFKNSIPWNVKSFVRAIFAMSNLKEGGYIIVGIDNDLNRIGVSESIKNTYILETMKDQINSFADPKVDFSISITLDKEGKEYIIIKIFEFEEVPVLCKKDSYETNQGTLYYRNSNRRPESAPISNSTDMREIIELAAIKKMKKITSIINELGVKETFEDKEKLNEELEGL